MKIRSGKLWHNKNPKAVSKNNAGGLASNLRVALKAKNRNMNVIPMKKCTVVLKRFHVFLAQNKKKSDSSDKSATKKNLPRKKQQRSQENAPLAIAHRTRKASIETRAKDPPAQKKRNGSSTLLKECFVRLYRCDVLSRPVQDAENISSTSKLKVPLEQICSTSGTSIVKENPFKGVQSDPMKGVLRIQEEENALVPKTSASVSAETIPRSTPVARRTRSASHS